MRVVGLIPFAPVVALFMVLFMAPGSMYAQAFEISGNGGIGVAERDSFGFRSVPSGGATLAWGFTPGHKLQFDYSFGHMDRSTSSAGGLVPSIHNRHFFTGSYIFEFFRGRARPFLQAGGGVQYETNNDNQVVNRDLSEGARTGPAGVAGSGVTISLGRSLFVRPQLRAYFAGGPLRTVNVTTLPSVTFGWRF